MSLWYSEKAPEVTAGSAYQRTHPDRVVETARVLSLHRDSLGIPHVRFMVSYQRRARTVLEDGPRLLALSVFRSHYSESASA